MVRFVDPADDAVTNEAFVNSATGEIRWVLPLKSNAASLPRTENGARPRAGETESLAPVRPLDTPTSDYLWAVEGGTATNSSGFWCFERRKMDLGEIAYASFIRDKLKRAKVPSSSIARRKATDMIARASTFGPIEFGRIAGLIRCGAEVSGFAARGDLIWIVRMEDSNVYLANIAWVSSTTGAIRWALNLRNPQTKGARFTRQDDDSRPAQPKGS